MTEKKPSNSGADRATREFAESSNPMVKQGKRSLASVVKRFLRKYKIPLILIVLLPLVIASVISVFSSFSDVPEQEAVEGETFTSDASVNPDEILDAYLLKNVGALEADGLRSVRLGGRFVSEDSEQAFTVIKKYPNFAYIKFYLPRGYEITYGSEGDRIWSRLDGPGAPSKVEWASDEIERNLKPLTNFFAPLVEVALRQRDLVRSIEWSGELGVETIAVAFEHPFEDYLSVAHIDPETLSVLSRFDHLSEMDIRRVDFDDFRVEAGYRFPHSITYSSDQGETQLVDIDKITLNQGVISDLFNPPEGLE
jgi:hypothetical protein